MKHLTHIQALSFICRAASLKGFWKKLVVFFPFEAAVEALFRDLNSLKSTGSAPAPDKIHTQKLER